MKSLKKNLVAFVAIFASLTLALSAGCSMCCGPYDYDYPTFGGLRQRVDRQHGRVGSIFSDPSITSEVVTQAGTEEIIQPAANPKPMQ